MRTTLFTGVCVMMTLVSGGALAQTQKGAKLIGTSLGGASYGSGTATSSSDDPLFPTGARTETSSYSIFVSPRVGWFVKDNLAVGGAARIAYFSAKADQNYSGMVGGTQNSTRTAPSIFVVPFARYYFKGSESAKPFVEANVSFAFDPAQQKSSTSMGTISEVRTTPRGNYGAGLTIGYEHFINETVGIIVSSGVNYSCRKTENEARYSLGPALGPYTLTTTTTTKEWTVPLTVGLEIHLP